MTWPAPEVLARRATNEEIPRGAWLVVRLAETCGWSVIATYARGTAPGRPPRVVDSLALRMRRGPRRAVGVWEDRRFTMAILFGDRHYQTCSATKLKEELAT